jgi:hypothetical protein
MGLWAGISFVGSGLDGTPFISGFREGGCTRSFVVSTPWAVPA